jgi:hypothetical protein
MRLLANVRKPGTGVARCILYESADGVYVFPCASLEDGSATGDWWFSSAEEAFRVCDEEFGILAEDWRNIDDPLPDCQDDWIAPVRIVGRNEGAPQWGRFERLVNGKWVPIEKPRGAL